MDLDAEIRRLIEEIEPRLVEIRQDLHHHPELGFEETRTAALVADKLKELGFEVKTGVAKTGVVGLLKGRGEGPVVALRADMDALPIEEKNDLPYASGEKGKMHACGHDAHVAILLGVAMVLSRLKDKIPGQVKLIFQPAEEGPGGARPMIKEGVLDNPAVDAILGLHVWLDIPAGKIGVKTGPTFASIDEFDLVVKGSSSHGASPHQGIDAVLVAAQMVNALQSTISRSIDPTEPGVVTIGKIEGGYRRNIIADQVRLEGTVRCVRPEIRKQLEKKIRQIIQGISNAYGSDYELDYRHDYPPLINNQEVTGLVSQISEKVVGPENVIGVEKPTLGGEDFAYFLEKVPGCFFLLGGRNEEKGITAPHHNPYFNLDESVMPIGVEVLVRATLELLNKGEDDV
ncbi:MAG: hypothetical protein PWR10_2528 [Halanaerobiales bacterium]|nr:hypothetical protein [Halanaerobiales bacterium]